MYSCVQTFSSVPCEDETVNDTLAERADASDAADGAEGAQEGKERNCLLSFVCVCSRPSSFREGVTMIVTTKIKAESALGGVPLRARTDKLTAPNVAPT